MARLECCRKTETAIFAAHTKLPVSDFQTWQVCSLSEDLENFTELYVRRLFDKTYQNNYGILWFWHLLIIGFYSDYMQA